MRILSKTNISDEALIQRFKTKGDLSALGALHQRYSPLIFGVCMKYLKDPHDSEDATVGIFEELLKRLPNHEVNNFKSWLYVLTKNYCLQIIRKKKVHTTEISEELVHIPEEMHPDDRYLMEHRSNGLKDCINQLPDTQKKSIEMFYFESLSYSEIAMHMNVDKEKVRSYIQNGRRNLKNCMLAKDGKQG